MPDETRWHGESDTRPDPDPTRLTTDQLRRELLALRELVEGRLDSDERAAELILANRQIVTDGLATTIDTKVSSLQALMEARLHAIEEANRLLATEVSTQPGNTAAQHAQIRAEVDAMIHSTRELLETRFSGMDEATKLLALNVDKVPYAILQEAGNLKALLEQKINAVEKVAQEKFDAIQGTFASNALALTAALAAQKEAAAEQNKSNTLAITKSEQATKETIASNAAQTGTGQSALSRELADLKERLVRIESGGVASAVARSEHRLDAGQVMAAVSLLVAIAVAIILIVGH